MLLYSACSIGLMRVWNFILCWSTEFHLSAGRPGDQSIQSFCWSRRVSLYCHCCWPGGNWNFLYSCKMDQAASSEQAERSCC